MLRDLAVVVSGFPRLSETFALGELLALEERGALTAIFATKGGDGAPTQPGVERLMSRVVFLPEGAPGLAAAAIEEHSHDRRIAAVHGYFAHAPAQLAREAALRLGIPYGFSVHAKDARKVDPVELRRRAAGASCVVACNTDVAADLRAHGIAVSLIPHGVDLTRFSPRPLPPEEPFRVLAVGRLVAKKGFDILLRALALMSPGVKLSIVGEGPEQTSLLRLADELRIGDRLAWLGSLDHDQLPQVYADAHVIATPSVVDTSGDRDGLPNVVLEAMACGRAVVGSDAAALTSAVKEGETGRVVPAGDASALAAALESLREPDLRARLGAGARRLMEERYSVERCTERFYTTLEAAYA